MPDSIDLRDVQIEDQYHHMEEPQPNQFMDDSILKQKMINDLEHLRHSLMAEVQGIHDTVYFMSRNCKYIAGAFLFIGFTSLTIQVLTFIKHL